MTSRDLEWGRRDAARRPGGRRGGAVARIENRYVGELLSPTARGQIARRLAWRPELAVSRRAAYPHRVHSDGRGRPAAAARIGLTGQQGEGRPTTTSPTPRSRGG